MPVTNTHPFHYHLTVVNVNGLKKLKLCKIKLSPWWRDTLHFFWQSFNVSIKCRAAASWELFMPFSPFVSWPFLPHIIKLTSVEVFWRGNDSRSVTQSRWINIRMFGVEHKRWEKCSWLMAVNRELILSGVLEARTGLFLALL